MENFGCSHIALCPSVSEFTDRVDLLPGFTFLSVPCSVSALHRCRFLTITNNFPVHNPLVWSSLLAVTLVFSFFMIPSLSPPRVHAFAQTWMISKSFGDNPPEYSDISSVYLSCSDFFSEPQNGISKLSQDLSLSTWPKVNAPSPLRKLHSPYS